LATASTSPVLGRIATRALALSAGAVASAASAASCKRAN
jgi:hypothetical protein